MYVCDFELGGGVLFSPLLRFWINNSEVHQNFIAFQLYM